ncbi:MAG: hypothetical protein D6788_03910, partial [Planctomycetota bacterium]
TLLEERRLRLPCDERICNDFVSVERTVTRTGHLQLSAPRREGSHADRFWAAALAVRAAGDARGTVEALSVGPLAFARRGTW